MSTPINIWRKNFHSPPPVCLKLQQSLALGIHNEKNRLFCRPRPIPCPDTRMDIQQHQRQKSIRFLSYIKHAPSFVNLTPHFPRLHQSAGKSPVEHDGSARSLCLFPLTAPRRTGFEQTAPEAAPHKGCRFGGPHFAFSNASAFRAAFASDQKGKQIIVITMVRIAQTTFMGVPIFTKSLKR